MLSRGFRSDGASRLDLLHHGRAHANGPTDLEDADTLGSEFAY